MKKVLSLFLVVLMVCGMVAGVPASAQAAEVTALLEKYQSYDQDLFNSNGVAAIQTAISTLQGITGTDASAISAAQAADTAAQAGMAGNLADGIWIPYSKKDVYQPYLKAGVMQTDYAIAEKADWLALVNDTTTGDKPKFSGYTFHFTKDVDMGGTNMLPLSYGSEFNGNINGHDKVIKNINITVNNPTKPIGLISMLGWGYVKNLGIESGTIRSTGSAIVGVAGFAGQLHGAYLYNCWNGASISTETSNNRYGPAGLTGHISRASVIDNCFNIGTITADNLGVAHSLSSYTQNLLTVYNCIAAGTVTSSRYSPGGVRVHSNIFGKNTGCPVINTYAVGMPLLTADGNDNTEVQVTKLPNGQYFTLSNTNALFGAGSVGEAAWTVNKNFDSTKQSHEVYYTLSENGTLKFGTAANQVRKITFDGIKTDVYYYAAGSTVDIAEKFGVNPQNPAWITQGSQSTLEGMTLSLGNEDITIKVINDCSHEEGFAYTPNGDGTHEKACKKGCGFIQKQDCAAEQVAPNAITAAELTDREQATHGGACALCEEEYQENCTYTYVAPATATDEHYWDFSGCTCGRENIENQGTADLFWGDAHKDGKVNLYDAIMTMRFITELENTLNQKNADANGDGVLSANDAVLIVRFWLGEQNAVAMKEQVTAYANCGNLYDKVNATLATALLRDGTTKTDASMRITAPIATKEGERLVFGPVRLGQGVLGYAYDAQNQAVALINYENVEVMATLKEGMALVAYEVPAGVSSVRFNIGEGEKDLFMIRRNSEMKIDEYEARLGADSDTVANPLQGKNVLCVGDSICEAARDSAVGGLKGWARRIAQEYGAKVTNSGLSGAALNSVTRTTNTQLGMIANQISQHEGKTFDYILIHGGVNDAWDNVAIGTVSQGFKPENFDTTTYAGGLEMAIYTAVKNHGNTAAIGYLINFESPLHSAANDSGNYFAVGKQICEKWGIAYLDLFAVEFDTTVYTADFIHPNEAGYDVIGPHVNAFMKEMRPVSQEVWEAVQ